MIKTECDNCHTLGDAPPPPGWIVATEITQPEHHEGLAGLLSGGMGTEAAGTFCGYRCMGEYATAKGLLGSAGTGEVSP